MKNKRQAKIMEIISNRNVETQEQLLKELKTTPLYWQWTQRPRLQWKPEPLSIAGIISMQMAWFSL